MRTSLPPNHHFSIDPDADWAVDEIDQATSEQLGIYVRSIATGIYVNVRKQDAGDHPLTSAGMLTLLREQNWASPPFDEWTATANGLVIVGGTFETVDMNGEVVIEAFITDGELVANLAAPAERAIARAMAPSIEALAKTISFSTP